ncbi:MAG: beta-lactamase family protein [Hyphomicrobiales bacterium]|nr:beta-lactamase family protein [Hyphomicrobiales bacterium]
MKTSRFVSAAGILGILLASSCGSTAPALAESGPATDAPLSAQAFAASVERLAADNNARAVIAGIWHGNGPGIQVAVGESMAMVPADTDMTVRIGGISQLFLGSLLMRLVEQGHLSLDDKVSQYLPALLAADAVTVRMLAQNTAGYKDYVRDDRFIDLILADPFRQFSSEELIDFATQDGELNFAPGTEQRYSHTEFTILKEVIENATGQPMAELYQQEILDPLGLTGTGYSMTPDLPGPVLHVFGSDRGVYEDVTFWNPSWAGESGPLYSNLDDLGRWGPAFGTGQLLSAQSFQDMIRRPDVAPRDDLYFATGFVVANGWYMQNPNINGYSGAMGYLPAEDLTLAVFASQAADPKVEHPALAIFKELVLELAPDHAIGF